jgi:DNA-binding transcriptional ArsR family regulator
VRKSQAAAPQIKIASDSHNLGKAREEEMVAAMFKELGHIVPVKQKFKPQGGYEPKVPRANLTIPPTAGTMFAAVYDWVMRHGGAFKASDIATAIGEKRNTVSSALPYFEKAGVIKRTGEVKGNRAVVWGLAQ